MAAFHLSRMEPADMAEASDVLNRAIADWSELSRDIYSGPDTPEKRLQDTKRFREMMVQDPQQYWIKVTDKSTGKLVAGSMWRIHMTVVPDRTLAQDHPRPWLHNEKERSERVKSVVELMAAARKTLYTQPHVQAHIFFTDPEYVRRGAGSLMVKWGCDLADHLFLPMWIESSAKGRKLYEKFGFVVRQKIVDDDYIMGREVRASQIEGGIHSAV